MQSFEGPYDAYVGFDVGKLSHRACCVLAGGAVAFNVGVANDEAAIDRVLAEAAAHGRSLAVVDQRRNIGTTVVRRARAAGIEVAYLPGIAANRASSLFPGDAKTDERDAEVIARTAMGVPQALRPVPEEGTLDSVAVDDHVAGDHAHVLAAQHVHQVEEFFAHQRLNGRGVVGALAGAQRHEAESQRHQALARAGRGAQHHVRA